MSLPARASLSAFVLLTGACALLPGDGCSRSDHKPPWAGGLPYLADANGDGVEDMITFGSAYGFTAYDGATYQPLWTREELDIDLYSAGRLGAVAGSFIAVAAERSIHLVELASGKTAATVPLSDKVISLCGDGATVWVRQLDEVTGLLDLGRGPQGVRLDTAAVRPAACEPPRGQSYACAHSAARCESKPGSMNLRLHDTTSSPPAVAAVELKQPGTPEVTLIFADANGGPEKRILFDREGHRVDAVDFAGGHFFLKGLAGVTAIDAATGATMWTLPCGGNTPYLRATPTRVYVECDGHRNHEVLRVVDHTGKVRIDLGESRY